VATAGASLLLLIYRLQSGSLFHQKTTYRLAMPRWWSRGRRKAVVAKRTEAV
jgi:hypothetical protein